MNLWRNWSKRKKNAVIGLILGVFLVLALFMPEAVLNQIWNTRLEIAVTTDAAYQGEALTVRDSKINYYDKVVLVNGSIEKNQVEIKAPEEKDCMNLSMAAKLCRDAIAGLYEAGIYPVLLDRGFKNWYSYSGTLYQYTEQYFGYYTCFVWVVDFRLYDQSLSHRIYVDGQTGELLKAEMTGLSQADYPKDRVDEITVSDTEKLYRICSSDKEKFTVLFSTTVESPRETAEETVEQMPETIQKSFEEMIGAPEVVTLTLPPVGGNSQAVRVNAQVMIPDVDGMDVVQVVWQKIDEKDLKKLCDLSFPEGTVYNPPDLVQSVIDDTSFLEERWKSYYDGEDLLNFDNFNRFSNIVLEGNGDAFRYVDMKDYSGNLYSGFLCLGRKDAFEGYLSVKDSEITYAFDDDNWVPSGDIMVGRSNILLPHNVWLYKEDFVKDQLKSEMLYEIQRCRDLMEKLGLEGYEVVFLESRDYEKRGAPYGLKYIVFSKFYDGIYISDCGKQGYHTAVNKMNFAVHNNEYENYIISSGIEFGNILAENVELMPFSQISEGIEHELEINLMTQAGYNNPEFRICLEYALLDNPDDVNDTIIVPVWNYYMASVAMDEQKYPARNYVCFLSVNAIDGSVIYDESAVLKYMNDLLTTPKG